MTLECRYVTPTGNRLGKEFEVEDVPTSLAVGCEEQEGMTHTTVDLTQTTQLAEETNSTEHQDMSVTSMKELVEDTFGIPYREIQIMNGQQLRAIGDNAIHKAYVNSKKTTDQYYFPRTTQQ